MNLRWIDRPVITANLLNPAFCGEVFRRVIFNYERHAKRDFPFSLAFIVLPLLLSKKIREKFPSTSRSHFHIWVNENSYLFMDFPNRSENLVSYAKEALLFLMANKCLTLEENGTLKLTTYRKKIPSGAGTEEVLDIYKKAEFLGKWLALTGNEQTIYMFLKIRP